MQNLADTQSKKERLWHTALHFSQSVFISVRKNVQGWAREILEVECLSHMADDLQLETGFSGS